MVNLKYILDVLKLDDHYGISEEIDIAKGKYQLPKGMKHGLKILKRKWQKRK